MPDEGRVQSDTLVQVRRDYSNGAWLSEPMTAQNVAENLLGLLNSCVALTVSAPASVPSLPDLEVIHGAPRPVCPGCGFTPDLDGVCRRETCGLS